MLSFRLRVVLERSLTVGTRGCVQAPSVAQGWSVESTTARVASPSASPLEPFTSCPCPQRVPYAAAAAAALLLVVSPPRLGALARRITRLCVQQMASAMTTYVWQTVPKPPSRARRQTAVATAPRQPPPSLLSRLHSSSSNHRSLYSRRRSVLRASHVAVQRLSVLFVALVRNARAFSWIRSCHLHHVLDSTCCVG